jgi:hypothetical protein
MRKQYYFRESPQGLLAWDVDRLVELSKAFTRKMVPLSGIRELPEDLWGDSESQRLEHLRLIDAADLSYPIILSANGAVMDGRHRCPAATASTTRQNRTMLARRRPTMPFVRNPRNRSIRCAVS